MDYKIILIFSTVVTCFARPEGGSSYQQSESFNSGQASYYRRPEIHERVSSSFLVPSKSYSLPTQHSTEYTIPISTLYQSPTGLSSSGLIDTTRPISTEFQGTTGPEYISNVVNTGPSGFSNFQQPQTIITKDVYVHAAPPDEDDEFLSQPAAPVVNRKNYKIIFIKAPTVNLRPLQQRPRQDEVKTIVYVLVKKPDLQTSFNTIEQQRPKSIKPEVYFIKYKSQDKDRFIGSTLSNDYSPNVNTVSEITVPAITGNGGTRHGAASYGPANYRPPAPLSSYPY